MHTPKAICVYCASSSKADECYYEAAHQLGSLMGERGITLITGGGCQGLMRSVEDGALESGGTAIGVIPEFMVEQGWHHTGLSKLLITKDMHERKQTMANMSDAIIALPGGCGTMEELCEIITWKQLGLYLKPIVILNTNGYYDHLIKQLGIAIEEHFMGKIHGDIWRVATTPQEALDIVNETPVWSNEIRKYAAL
ncbi:MAG: TIGR00730 family Rossman fold protein [Bacteroidaceae bacterium]|nr:TIGR00730 family Rossman fold protein [Bacteroidaceae bacterium]